MRILVLSPRDTAAALASPLLALGHDVAAVASDAGPLPPPAPEGVTSWTRGRWLAAYRALAPEAVLALVDDPGGEELAARVQGAASLSLPAPGEHSVPRDLLADPDALQDVLAALFPPAVPEELARWLSGAQGAFAAETEAGLPEPDAVETQGDHAVEPAPRRTRKRAQVKQED